MYKNSPYRLPEAHSWMNLAMEYIRAYVLFFMILYLQNLLISNLPGAKMTFLGNFRY